jgi:hypothetical protein
MQSICEGRQTLKCESSRKGTNNREWGSSCMYLVMFCDRNAPTAWRKRRWRGHTWSIAARKTLTFAQFVAIWWESPSHAIIKVAEGRIIPNALSETDSISTSFAQITKLYFKSTAKGTKNLNHSNTCETVFRIEWDSWENFMKTWITRWRNTV